MKVFITGASGLVGSNLIRHLLDSGFTVRALLDPRLDTPTLDGLPFERVPGDVLDPESILGGLAGTQAVFHCALVTELRPLRYRAARAKNVDGTRNLLVGMSRSGVENLVYVSAASSFGPGTMDEPGTEETPFDPQVFRSTCFDSIHQAQELVLRYNQSGKVRCVVVNPTLVMGEYGLPCGPGTDVMEYSSVGRHTSGGANVVGAADVARGILKALGRGKAGRCYILGGSNVPYRDLFSMIAASMGFPPTTRLSGDRAVITRGLAGSLYGRLTGRVPARSAGAARLAVAPIYYSPRRATLELELPVSPLDTVVESACRWLTDNKDIIAI